MVPKSVSRATVQKLWFLIFDSAGSTWQTMVLTMVLKWIDTDGQVRAPRCSSSATMRRSKARKA